jgi:beta-phosphoglucomutase-like phosphatase (HAD superfamily)
LDEVICQAQYLLFSFDGPIRSADTGNPPAPYVHDALVACRESGRSAAVVTRTPSTEVRAYLDAHDLSGLITVIAASIPEAIRALDASPTDCVAIAKSLSDKEAARAAGAPHIAYAKTRDDADRQADTGASAFVYSLAEVTLRLRGRG